MVQLVTHPGYPKIIKLATRLGVKPYNSDEDAPAVVIACGPNASDPMYSLEDLITAALDRIDAQTP